MKKQLITAMLAVAGTMTVVAYDGDKSEWMKHIPGSTFACQVTIPGSHDSATGEGWASALGSTYSQAQDIKIDDQLAQGARGFDIRPNKSGNNWVCSHGMHNTKLSLTDCFNKFVSFLNAHPSEFIIIYVYKGGSGDWDDTKKADYVSFLEGYADRLVNFRRDLTVDELRGKILVFTREDCLGATAPIGASFKEPLAGDGWGSWIDWKRQTNITAVAGNIESNLSHGRVFYQDLADTHESGKIEEKLAGIRQLLDFSTAYRPVNPENCIWYFNFASGYSKVGAFNTSQSDGYRDNATFTNPCFIDYLKANPGPAGVVLADYICTDNSGSYNTRGSELIDVLIDNNFKYLDYVDNGVGTPAPYAPSTDGGTHATWEFNPASRNFQATQRSSAIMADFSGNGNLDIISGGNNDHAKLLVNNGNWDVVSLHDQANGVVQTAFPHYCALDFNNDGKVDLLVSGVSDHTANYDSHHTPYARTSGGYYAMTALYENLGDNNFRLVENAGLPIIIADNGKQEGDKIGYTSAPMPFAVGDFDHDGYVDIAVTGFTTDGSKETRCSALYRNNGDGTFSLAETFAPVSGNVHAADFNNDGWLDLAFDGEQYDAVEGIYTTGSNGNIYLNNEGNGFTKANSPDVRFYATRAGGSAVADFNKDGYLDFYTMGWGDHGLGYAHLLHYNNRGFGATGDIFITPEKLGDTFGLNGTENIRVAVRDINADGNLDIVYDGQWDNTVYYGSEAMRFSRGNPLGCRGGGAHDAASAFGDVTGNGLVDRYQTGYQWFDNEMMQKRHGGSDSGWNWEASLYENHTATAPASSAAPANVRSQLNGNKLEVRWDDVNDLTVAYNVIIWNETTGTVISTLPCNPALGTLSVADGKEAAIRPGVEYYAVTAPDDLLAARSRATSAYKVGIQSVGTYNENASEVAWSQPDVTAVETISAESNIKVTVNGDNVTVAAPSDCHVKIVDMLGRTVATGAANSPIALSGNGIFVVTTADTATKIRK